MSDLFNNLIISCPNGGGLFVAFEGEILKVDNTNTVGLHSNGSLFLRGAQPETLWVHDLETPTKTKQFPNIADIHDVLEWEGAYYVVGTTRNEILKIDADGKILHRWEFPGEEDSMHLNCLGVWGGKLVFSAFGDFSAHRGYKGFTEKAGFVQDLESGQRIITGLSQPHSLFEIGDNLLVANSECLELREYSKSGACIRSRKMEGYTRGICQVADTLYVGLSRSRNVSDADISSATIVALDALTWEEKGRVALDANEIYSVVFIPNTSAMVKTVFTAVGFSAEKRLEELHASFGTVRENVAALKELRESVADKDQQLSTLQNELLASEERFLAMDHQWREKENATASVTFERMRAAVKDRELEVSALLERHASELAHAVKETQLKTEALHSQQEKQRLLEKDLQISSLQMELRVFEERISAMDTLWQEREAANSGLTIERIKDAVRERELETINLLLQHSNELKFAVEQTGLQIKALNHQHDVEISQIRSSTSWRLTKPVRLVGYLAKRDWSNIRLGLKGSVPSVANAGTRIVRLGRAAKYAVNHYGSVGLAIAKTVELYRKHGLGGIRIRAAALLMRNGQGGALAEDVQTLGGLYETAVETGESYRPLVSVIVPNYNHARYLRERLDSIYAQSYENIEVILLDDLSTDDSRDLLSEYANRYPEKTQCVFNSKNSGGVFNQWKKGLACAKGEIIWIAESDDYSSPNFIEENVKNFSNEAVMLSFARSVFVSGDSGNVVWSTEEYLDFMGAEFWSHPFVKSAHWLVNNCWSLKNIVPNVSSALFRNPGEMTLLDDKQWSGMKVCGDWVFYLHLVRGGLVSYTPAATNFYRQHDNNTSVTSQSTDRYYREHEYVATQMLTLYDVDKDMLIRLQDDVRKQWAHCRPDEPEAALGEFFDLNRIQASASARKPNLLVVVYALAAGGGETFPLLLANQMKRNGYGVTVLNCHEQPTEQGVRAMLRSDIPLLQLRRLDLAPGVIHDFGVEVIHSHHAWVDITFASLMLGQGGAAHVVSMHGMYEMMPDAQLTSLLPLMERGFHRIVYTAEKNLGPFCPEFRVAKGFTRIDNALPITAVNPISRAELGIGEDDFVLCLVSRAIPEKGWAESVAAVEQACASSGRDIHLVLIGEGPEYDLLMASGVNENIHLLGFKKNIRDYFSMADVGLLPSRFKGESYPLVLIDCLHAGTPLLASNVGEINTMLSVDGGKAGVLFDLDDWQIPVDVLAEHIVKLSDPESGLLSDLRARVPAAAQKFDPEQMFRSYDKVYREAVSLCQLGDNLRDDK